MHSDQDGLPKRDAGHLSAYIEPLDPKRFSSIVHGLLGDPVKALSNAKSWRYGRKGGLSVDVVRGVWFAHDGGAGGGIFDLVVWLGHTSDRAGAAEWLRQGGWMAKETARRVGGESLHQKAERLAIDAAEVAQKRAVASALWDEALVLDGSPAWLYLTGPRAIPGAALEGVKELRFHPAAPISPYINDGRKCPALIARVTNPAGLMVGAHLTYLRKDGSGKAALPTTRKWCGKGFRGASVRLGAGADVIVAEGIESALSAGSARGLSPVAALSAGGVKSWRAWVGVGSVAFAPDVDPTGLGMQAARFSAQTLHAAGVKVAGFALPPGGHCDWNDAQQAGLLVAKAVQS